MIAQTTIAGFIEAQTPVWVEQLRALIRERSVFEREQGIVQLVESRIQALGLDAVRVTHDATHLASLPGAMRPFSSVPDRHSVVTRVQGSGGGRSIAFNTHLDIVAEGDTAAWTCHPFDGEVREGAVYGRGAMDDKAGVAIALALLETIVRVPVKLAGDVVFHFVLEDETTGNGSLLCLDAGHRADAAVIVDGTRPGRAIDGHAGQLQFDLTVKGRPASVTVSHMGVNAADLIARLVARLADAVAPLNGQRSERWVNSPTPFQLVTQRLASLGTQLTVPEHAEATCYVTFPPPWTLARMRDFLEETVRAFAKERDLETTPVITWTGFCSEPVASNADELCAALRACAERAGFGQVEVGPSTGTSDLRHFATRDIPCVLYGPGTGFNPHRANEHYRVDDLPRMVSLFVDLARTWTA